MNKNAKNAAAYYEGGRAVALETLGSPVPAISLSDVPRMRVATARRELAEFSRSNPLHVTAAEADAELLPRLTGAAAMLRAGKIDHKLQNGVALEANKIAGAMRLSTADEVQSTIGRIDARARELVAWRWHAIERVANALLRRGTLTSDEVAALLTA